MVGFIPRQIKVGYNHRCDTYTGKLAYVIYYDEKGVLRKETSWDNWRSKEIPYSDIENIPTEGFVLNKKAGGERSGWDARNTYCRVYDPRGFEIEISISNLLYILENTNCIQGKGLEGEFVYCWKGTELLLVPCSALDYKESQEHSDLLFENKKFKSGETVDILDIFKPIYNFKG